MATMLSEQMAMMSKMRSDFMAEQTLLSQMRKEFSQNLMTPPATAPIAAIPPIPTETSEMTKRWEDINRREEFLRRFDERMERQPLVRTDSAGIKKFDPFTGAPLAAPTACFDPYTGKRLNPPAQKPEIHLIPSPTPTGANRMGKRKSDASSSSRQLDKGNSDTSTAEDDDVPAEKKRRSTGDGQGASPSSPSKPTHTFKTHRDLKFALEASLNNENSGSATFGSGSTDLTYQREGTSITRTLTAMSKYFPTVLNSLLLANRYQPLPISAEVTDHTLPLSNFVYETLTYAHSSFEIRQLMYNNPTHRTQLNQQEKLLGTVICGSEEDYLATLRAARSATILRGSAKFLLPAKVATPGTPLNPSPGTPQNKKCAVCKKDYHGPPIHCRERCHTCKGNPPLKAGHAGNCN